MYVIFYVLLWGFLRNRFCKLFLCFIQRSMTVVIQGFIMRLLFRFFVVVSTIFLWSHSNLGLKHLAVRLGLHKKVNVSFHVVDN